MWCLSKPVIKKKSNSESEPTTKIQQKKNLYENKCTVCKKKYLCVLCVYKGHSLFFMSLSELYYNFKKHFNQMAILQNCQFNTKTKSRKL